MARYIQRLDKSVFRKTLFELSLKEFLGRYFFRIALPFLLSILPILTYNIIGVKGIVLIYVVLAFSVVLNYSKKQLKKEEELLRITEKKERELAEEKRRKLDAKIRKLDAKDRKIYEEFKKIDEERLKRLKERKTEISIELQPNVLEEQENTLGSKLRSLFSKFANWKGKV